MIPLLANGFDNKEAALIQSIGIEAVQNPPTEGPYCIFKREGLCAVVPGEGELFVDFLSPELQRRIGRKSIRNEMVVKAVFPKLMKSLVVWDLTAGLGVDAFLLAAAGAEVTMLERSPILHALLKDGLDRMSAYEHGLKLQLGHGEALDFLGRASTMPDVIYLDPMHPKRRSAGVNKKMSLLQLLVGEDADFVRLFEASREKALRRVVVKWPLKIASPLPQPSHSLEGRSMRFDIFTLA